MGLFGLFENRKEENIQADAAAAPEQAPDAPVQETAGPEEKAGFFARLKKGLTKTRDSLSGGIDNLLNGYAQIDDDLYDELEEIMITGDMGVHATQKVLEDLRREVREQHIRDPKQCRELLIRSIRDEMQLPEDAYAFENVPSIVTLIGVNGVGKTTSVGKLAGIYKARGKKVLMISGAQGADPGSVIFDAVSAAKARGVDILLCDTAGRLHNKKNLMEELAKTSRIIDREYPEAHRENLIVLDAATGQNALQQAREFTEAAGLTGIILTKMDGTAKGGIAVAIQSELSVPVKFIGVGE